MGNSPGQPINTVPKTVLDAHRHSNPCNRSAANVKLGLKVIAMGVVSAYSNWGLNGGDVTSLNGGLLTNTIVEGLLITV